MAEDGNTHLNLGFTFEAINVAVFLFFFGTNLYSSLKPHGYGRGGDTYITPANFTFYVWTIIDFLLLGYVIYQFFDESHDIIHGVGWWFALVAVLNAIFIHVFVTGHYIVAFIFAIFVAITVSKIYFSLKFQYPPKSYADSVWIHLPFSLWHAWSIVTLIIAAFAAFTAHGHGKHPSIAVKVLVILAEVFLSFTAWAYALQSAKGDIAGAIVLSWTLLGIFVHQHNALIKFFALGTFIFSLFAILKSFFFIAKETSATVSVDSDERAPLLA